MWKESIQPSHKYASKYEYIRNVAPEDIRSTGTPNYGGTVSGYGGKLPTSKMIRLGKRWYRVYVACYSNCGSAYIIQNGLRCLLSDTAI